MPSDDKRAPDAREIGGQVLGHAIDKVVLRRIAAEIGERQHDDGETRRAGLFRRETAGRGVRLSRIADVQRIDPDRFGDVLELGRAEVPDGEIEPPLDLPIGVLGQADPAGRGDPLQSRGDIDAVAHQIAVSLLDDVAEMNADAKIDAALGRHAGVAFDEAVLHLDGAAHRVDDAAKLDEAAVAGALDDAPVMRGDGGIDQIAAQRPEPCERALFVRAREPAVADHVRDQDRSDLASFGHGAPSRVMQNSTNAGVRRRAS